MIPEVTAAEAVRRLRDWLEADHPETIQLDGDAGVVRGVLRRVDLLAKGKGFLAGPVDLAQVARTRGSARQSLGLEDVFQEWAQTGTANAKITRALSTHRQTSPDVRALMIVDALEYSGPEHIIDVKTRLRAFNNQIEHLHLWILTGCDPLAPGGSVASDLAAGWWKVVT